MTEGGGPKISRSILCNSTTELPSSAFACSFDVNVLSSEKDAVFEMTSAVVTDWRKRNQGMKFKYYLDGTMPKSFQAVKFEGRIINTEGERAGPECANITIGTPWYCTGTKKCVKHKSECPWAVPCHDKASHATSELQVGSWADKVEHGSVGHQLLGVKEMGNGVHIMNVSLHSS